MNNNDKIIDRIKKCMALGASSNEHEAAAALRQAQKLMKAHGISDLDMQAAEVSEARARSGAVKSPANWETCLASKIADAFGCRIIFSRTQACGAWAFIGVGAQEVAEYAFRVLFRQGKRARATYIKTRLNRCKPATKTRRADTYSEGWVRSVTELVDHFAGGETHPQALDAYISSKYPSLSTLQSRDRNAKRPGNYLDYLHGTKDGHDAQLNRGVGSAGTTLALGTDAEPTGLRSRDFRN